MLMRLGYLEGQFSPSEAAACTGLPLTLQRDWRALGLLTSNEGGHARFKPYELAMMKMMVRLRRHGFKPAESHAVALRHAPVLLYHCLDKPKGLALDDNSQRGRRYLEKLSSETDNGFRYELVDTDSVSEGLYLWMPQDSEPKVLASLDKISHDEEIEDVSYLSFVGMATKLVENLPRPLFTLKVPKAFT